MERKIDVKAILQLLDNGMSQRQIAQTRHVSRSSVSSVLKRAIELNLSFESLSDKTDAESYDLFFPNKGRKTEDF